MHFVAYINLTIIIVMKLLERQVLLWYNVYHLSLCFMSFIDLLYQWMMNMDTIKMRMLIRYTLLMDKRLLFLFVFSLIIIAILMLLEWCEMIHDQIAEMI